MSFLCPDVSDRIALSFFKELSFKSSLKRTGQSYPKRRDKETSCAGAAGELKDHSLCCTVTLFSDFVRHFVVGKKYGGRALSQPMRTQ